MCSECGTVGAGAALADPESGKHDKDPGEQGTSRAGPVHAQGGPCRGRGTERARVQHSQTLKVEITTKTLWSGRRDAWGRFTSRARPAPRGRAAKLAAGAELRAPVRHSRTPKMEITTKT